MIVINNDKIPIELDENEAIIYERREDKDNPEKATSYGLIFRCPKCKEATSGPHTWDRETLSLTPSIVHPCGYHGWLKNGEFTNA